MGGSGFDVEAARNRARPDVSLGLTSLDIHDVAGLVRYAIRAGLVTPDWAGTSFRCLYRPSRVYPLLVVPMRYSSVVTSHVAASPSAGLVEPHAVVTSSTIDGAWARATTRSCPFQPPTPAGVSADLDRHHQ